MLLHSKLWGLRCDERCLVANSPAGQLNQLVEPQKFQTLTCQGFWCRSWHIDSHRTERNQPLDAFGPMHVQLSSLR